MANLIFPTGFEEKTTIAQNDMILMADSEDSNKIKKAKYSNLKGEKGDTGPAGADGKDGKDGQDGKDGKDGVDGAAATITVGTTTTGEAGTDASVTNSGTSSAAVLNFTIPQGAAGADGKDGKDGVDGKDGKDGTDGQDGAAATITVGTTTTGSPGTNASVTNTGTSSAAVFDFTIPQGATGATGNGVASITSSKVGKITTVTITETNGDSESFTVSDGADGQGAGDVVGPNSSTDGHLAVFDGATGKLIKDGGSVPTGFNPGAGTTGQVLKKTNDGYGWANESGAVTSVNGQTGAVTLTIPSDTGDLTNGAGYITGISSGDVTTALGYTPANSANLGTAASKNTGTSSGNVPVLDSNGKLNTSTLPGVALTDTFTVTNKADLTSLSSADQGDIGIVTSESKTYVLSQAPYSTAANWKELLSPTDAVTSVNSKTGAVTLNADDISDSTTTNKFVTATDKSTWSGKQDALSYYSEGTNTADITVGSGGDTSSINASNNNGIELEATRHGYNTSSIQLGGTGAVIEISDSIDTTTVTVGSDNVTVATPNKTYTFDNNSTTGVARLSDIQSGIQNDTTGTTTTVTKIRAGSEAEYALITPDANTIYHIY